MNLPISVSPDFWMPLGVVVWRLGLTGLTRLVRLSMHELNAVDSVTIWALHRTGRPDRVEGN